MSHRSDGRGICTLRFSKQIYRQNGIDQKTDPLKAGCKWIRKPHAEPLRILCTWYLHYTFRESNVSDRVAACSAQKYHTGTMHSTPNSTTSNCVYLLVHFFAGHAAAVLKTLQGIALWQAHSILSKQRESHPETQTIYILRLHGQRAFMSKAKPLPFETNTGNGWP